MSSPQTMGMSDSQCEKTLRDFFERWTSVEEKISTRRSTNPKNYDLVHSISDNLKEIKKSTDPVTEWEKETIKVFQVLNPMVTRLITGLETANNNGVAINDCVPGILRQIHENVHEIKNGMEHIVRLPTVDHKPAEPKKRRATSAEPKRRRPKSWKKLMFAEMTMASPGMAMAKSTYDGLEPRVKLCFLSLSLFPENSVIRKRSLIYWWIGEGFVDGKDAERKAEECFKKLCHSGLVEAVQKKYSRSPRSCKLHPWIRWMAMEIAKETMFFDFDSDGKPVSGPSHCTRRACVATSGGEEVDLRAEKVNLEPNASKLRTLFNVDVNCIECDEEEFKKLKNLVTLQLGRWSTAPKHHIELVNPTFLDHLKRLKNLRYLGLQGISRITEVTKIQQLSELRVLDLRACHNLEKLPAEIASLKKLTHLDVSECYLLEYMPKGLGALSELQLLNGFVVNTWSQNACNVSELTELGNLQKLSISLGIEAMDMDGNPPQNVLDPIGEIKGLQSLRITWGSTSTKEEENDGTRKMMTANPATHGRTRWYRVIRKIIAVKYLVKPATAPNQTPSSKITLFLPPKLTKLDLQCYPEEEPPRFERKTNLPKEKSLEKLYFRGGRLKSLSEIQIDEVSKVKFIRLRFLKNFVTEGTDFNIKFPSLQLITAYGCPHIPDRELVFPEKNASPLTKDEASTSTNPST